MAYINEFPNWDSNKLNLDWILEQYSTFNQRIQEIQDHFDEVAEAMGQEVEQLESDFNDFKTLIDNNMDSFETQIQQELSSGLAQIQQQVTFISSNMADYISEHMNEWQAQAAYSDSQKRVNFNTSNNPLLNQNQSVYGFLIGNTIHETKLRPPYNYVSETNLTITNNLIDDCEITIEPGTFLVIAYVEFLSTPNTSHNVYASFVPQTDVVAIVPGHSSYFMEEDTSWISGTIPGSNTIIGIYTNTNTSSNSKIKIAHYNTTLSPTSIGVVKACAYKISDIWNPTE